MILVIHNQREIFPSNLFYTDARSCENFWAK